MKRFSVITLLLILLGSSPFVSAHEDTFTLRFGGAFSLTLPLSFFKNSTVLKSYDLSLVLPDKSSFTTQLITPELESLDPAFDMQLYPQYLFETAVAKDLPEQIIHRFKNSAEELKADLGNFSLKKFTNNDKTIYIAQGVYKSVSFIVLNKTHDQILSISSTGIKDDRLKAIIEGIR